LALVDPALWSLVDESAQAGNIIFFSSRYLPGNFGIAPTFQSDLSTETLIDRLMTAFYFMGWGWWVCLLGSLLLLIGCLMIKGMLRLRWMAITAIVVLAGQGLVLFPALAAQYLEEKGDHDLATGRYAQALQRYESAQRWNSQLASSERTHLRIGEGYYSLELIAHPNARLYLGERYAQQGNYKAAIAEYLMASQEASTPLKVVLAKRIAWIYIDRGMVQFRRGQVGPAIGHWERAVAFDQAQVQATYFLAKAYFDQARYEQSIAISRFLLSRSLNPLLNANIQANIGDSYWKLNDFDNARTAYEASMRLDLYGNYRIFKSLGGT
jgi:tetratricopeptide (TPR) repeat protein